MTTCIGVIDYGLANIRSVVNALSCFDIRVSVLDDGNQISDVDALVLPGVGSFDAGMRGLRDRGHATALAESVFAKKVPFLGICLGMQFVMSGSEEGSEKGLGWFDSTVRRLPDQIDGHTVKVPHIGWNEVRVTGNSKLFANIDDISDFYFNHSFYVPLVLTEESIVCHACSYGIDFAASLECENIYLAQFHPEKSQLAGMKLMETFVNITHESKNNRS